MKHIYHAFFLFLLHSLSAQTLRYSVTPNPVYTYFISDSTDHVGHATLKNLTKDSIFLSWYREIVEKPTDWKTLVCDCKLCYAPHVSRSPIINNMGVGDTCVLDVHMEDDKTEGVAHVVLWIYERQDTSKKYRADYYFNKIVSNNEVLNTVIKIFPNPASDHFTVDFNKGISKIELYTVLGNKIISFKAISKAKYDISQLNDGIYFIKLISSDNQLIRTVRLFKKSIKS